VEKGRPFLVELSEGAFSADAGDGGDDDCLRFFEAAEDVGADGGDDEYKKYYIDENGESVTGADESKQAPEEAAAEESAKGDEGAPEEAFAAAKAYVSPEEEARKIIALAEKRAERILEIAKQEAETLSMKLSAEISEGEVKKELAKNVATDIIDEANAEAGKLLAEAQEKARELFEEAKTGGRDEGFKAGRDEGYREGFEKGMAEGKLAGREEGKKEGMDAGEAAGRSEGIEGARREMAVQLAEATQKANNIIIEAEKEKEKIIGDADDKIVQIAMAVAEKILNKEISENPFIILQIVKEAAQKVADQPRLFVTVSTDNYEIACAACGDIKKALGNKQEISFAADDSFGPADVVIGTGGSGDVDARLKTQVAEIRKTIEAVVRQ
jgi:flagellar assembly protein FliH